MMDIFAALEIDRASTSRFLLRDARVSPFLYASDTDDIDSQLVIYAASNMRSWTITTLYASDVPLTIYPNNGVILRTIYLRSRGNNIYERYEPLNAGVNLAKDLVYCFLSRLDSVSLARASQVCRRWANVAAHTNLWTRCLQREHSRVGAIIHDNTQALSIYRDFLNNSSSGATVWTCVRCGRETAAHFAPVDDSKECLCSCCFEKIDTLCVDYRLGDIVIPKEVSEHGEAGLEFSWKSITGGKGSFNVDTDTVSLEFIMSKIAAGTGMTLEKFSDYRMLILKIGELSCTLRGRMFSLMVDGESHPRTDVSRTDALVKIDPRLTAALRTATHADAFIVHLGCFRGGPSRRRLFTRVRPAERCEISGLQFLSQYTISACCAPLAGDEAVEAYLARGDVERYLEENIDSCYVIVHNEATAGYAVAKKGTIGLLMIELPHQRHGLGTRLLKHMEKVLFEEGHQKLQAESFAGNDPANDFYEKNGWTEFSRRYDAELGAEKIIFVKRNTV